MPTAMTASGITQVMKRWLAGDAASRPTDMPSRQAISTRLLKNVRNITWLPNQRMHAELEKQDGEADEEQVDVNAASLLVPRTRPRQGPDPASTSWP